MFRDEALHLIDCGWTVFPLTPRGKAPLTPHGVKDATWDAWLVREWWERWPEANIGVATGQASGLYVIDLDGPQGVDSWEGLQLAHGDAPTLMAITGHGVHLYYSIPGGVHLGNTAKKIAPGIDSRGDGGYVLAPPSIHPNGRVYEWTAAQTPAPLPTWVAALVKDFAAPARQTRHVAPAYRAVENDQAAWNVLVIEANKVRSTGEGARNHALFTAALKMGGLVAGGDLLGGDVYDLLRDAGLGCGLPLPEVTRTLDSGLHLGMQSPRVVRTRR